MGDTWRGVETSTKAGETDQGVTVRAEPCTLLFKSLGSLRNVLVFERKANFLYIKITSN